MATTDRICVIGHANPDTDSVAAAIVYAWLLAQDARGGEVLAARAGPLNPQTSWVLDRLGVAAPQLITDAAPRFAAVVQRLPTVAPERPLADAWALLRQGSRVAPVVDDGEPVGLITSFSLLSLLTRHVDAAREDSLERVFQLACREAADTEVPRFATSARISDNVGRVLREERDDFWVVDEEGGYAGVCSKPRLLDPPRLKMVLVDHNEAGQSLAALEEAVLLEVLDHHRLDNPPTKLPIRFHVDPVGSTCTLVAERCFETGAELPPAMAGLLLAGALSDTLLLSSPTTSERDRAAVDRLGAICFAVEGSPLAGETTRSFGEALLRAGAGLGSRSAAEIVSGDFKRYEAGGCCFGVAQVEVTDLAELSEQREALAGALDELRQEQQLDFVALMVTDVVRGDSALLLRDAPAALDELPYPCQPDGTFAASGVVSRKKQLVPALLALLER